MPQRNIHNVAEFTDRVWQRPTGAQILVTTHPRVPICRTAHVFSVVCADIVSIYHASLVLGHGSEPILVLQPRPVTCPLLLQGLGYVTPLLRVANQRVEITSLFGPVARFTGSGRQGRWWSLRLRRHGAFRRVDEIVQDFFVDVVLGVGQRSLVMLLRGHSPGADDMSVPQGLCRCRRRGRLAR